MQKCETYDMKTCNARVWSHPHTYIFLVLEQNIKTKPKNLLEQFRRSRDCTEHVQQAVKPLGYP